MLPRRIPKKPKRASRWRSQKHTDWVKSHACSVCGSTTNSTAAHVRFGSHTGMAQKPDDWRTVSLCDGPYSHADGGKGCHQRQHDTSEPEFWRKAEIDVEQLIAEFCIFSPKAAEIRAIKAQRAREAA
jgi:hypothetical protein